MRNGPRNLPRRRDLAQVGTMAGFVFIYRHAPQKASRL
jgi:hypothetical protein